MLVWSGLAGAASSSFRCMLMAALQLLIFKGSRPHQMKADGQPRIDIIVERLVSALSWPSRHSIINLEIICPSHSTNANTTTTTTAVGIILAQEPPFRPQFDPCWLVNRNSTSTSLGCWFRSRTDQRCPSRALPCSQTLMQTTFPGLHLKPVVLRVQLSRQYVIAGQQSVCRRSTVSSHTTRIAPISLSYPAA